MRDLCSSVDAMLTSPRLSLCVLYCMTILLRNSSRENFTNLKTFIEFSRRRSLNLWEDVHSIFENSMNWNWRSNSIDKIMRNVVVTFAIVLNSILKSMILILVCIRALFSLHWKQTSSTCFIVIRSMSHWHVVVVTSSTRLSHKNWLNLIFSILNWTRSALCVLSRSMCSRRCLWVTLNVKLR